MVKIRYDKVKRSIGFSNHKAQRFCHDRANLYQNVLQGFWIHCLESEMGRLLEITLVKHFLSLTI